MNKLCTTDSFGIELRQMQMADFKSFAMSTRANLEG